MVALSQSCHIRREVLVAMFSKKCLVSKKKEKKKLGEEALADPAVILWKRRQLCPVPSEALTAK